MREAAQEYDEPRLTLGQLRRIAPQKDAWGAPAILATATASFAAMSITHDGETDGKVGFPGDAITPHQVWVERGAHVDPYLVVPFTIANTSERMAEPVLRRADLTFSIPSAIAGDVHDDAIGVIDPGPDSDRWTCTLMQSLDGTGIHVALAYDGILHPRETAGGVLRIALAPGSILVGRTIAFSLGAVTSEGMDMKGADAVATIVA